MSTRSGGKGHAARHVAATKQGLLARGFFGLAGYILSALRDLLRTRALRDCYELVNVNK